MSLCKHCGIEIKDDAEVCPLCGFALEHPHDETNMYPDIVKITKKISIAARIYVTLAIMTVLICIGVNYYDYETTHRLWCLVVAGALVLVYVILKVGVENEYGYHIKTFTVVFSSFLYLLMVDAVYGFPRWSLNFAYPIMILAIDVVVLVLMIVNFRNWQSYIPWQIFMLSLAVIGAILAHFGIIRMPRLIWITLSITAFFFIATVIIGGGRAISELKRRFHLL